MQQIKLLEKQIQNLILSWLSAQPNCMTWQNDSVGIWDAKKGIYRLPHGPFRKKGVADILGLYRGYFLAIEVKTKTGKVSLEQNEFIAQVVKHGGIAFVARSLEDVIEKLKNHDQIMTNDRTQKFGS